MSNVNIEYNLTFDGVDYLLILSVTDFSLKVVLETAKESLYWKGDFDAKYIEETTSKAGSYKAFNVFCKMFMSALSKESESVIIDLLHSKQLEKVKMKKMSQNSQNSFIASGNLNDSLSAGTTFSQFPTDQTKNNKMYLIMTYNNEFEKVHYPFPLVFIANPGADYLIPSMERMRKLINKQSPKENNTSNNIANINYKEIEELRQENINLRNKNKLLEGQRKFGAVENEEFIRTFTSIKEEYENYKQAAENKIKILAKTVEDLKTKINSQNNNLANSNTDNQNYIKELETQLEKASEIVTNERKKGQSFVEEKLKEIEKLHKEVHFLKENEKKLKVKINQLEKDLEISNRKNVYESKGKFNATPKSVYSNKSGSVRSGYSYNSHNSNNSKQSYNSKTSKGSLSTTSNIKKNLQVNPYNQFKGLHSKNYSPFKFFEKNEKSAKSGTNFKGNSNVSNRSVKSTNSQKSNRSATSGKTSGSRDTKKTIPTNNKINYSGSKNIVMKTKPGLNSKITPATTVTKGSVKLTTNTIKHMESNYSHASKQSFASKNLYEDKVNILNRIKSENENKINYYVKNEEGESTNLAKTANTANSATLNKDSGRDPKLDIKVFNANEINERLGRIQNLLNSAKV